MSDVSVLLLSLGKLYAGRALASLAQRTLRLAATIRVESVSPFHRALNIGAWQVRTAYFVQVDSDMILSPWFLDELR